MIGLLKSAFLSSRPRKVFAALLALYVLRFLISSQGGARLLSTHCHCHLQHERQIITHEQLDGVTQNSSQCLQPSWARPSSAINRLTKTDQRHQRPLTPSIPDAVYRLAKPVFDALPARYLPDYRSPCWAVNATGRNQAATRLSGRLRCLPSFYIVGMPKCGTTDLWDKLTAHPHVCRYCGDRKVTKEPHWWTRHRFEGRSFDYYLKGRSAGMLDVIDLDTSLKTKLIVGDASVSTMWDYTHLGEMTPDHKRGGPNVTTADLIHAMQPDAKLLAMYREPAARLYSDYVYINGKNVKPESFHKMVQRAVTSFQTCTRNMTTRGCLYNRHYAEAHIRLKLGVYVEYLKDWLRVFPRDQFFFLRLEDWTRDCPGTLPRVFDFLNLQPLPAQEVREICGRNTKNANTEKTQSIGGMLNQTRALLQEFYSEYNQELSQLLNDDGYLWQ